MFLKVWSCDSFSRSAWVWAGHKPMGSPTCPFIPFPFHWDKVCYIVFVGFESLPGPFSCWDFCLCHHVWPFLMYFGVSPKCIFLYCWGVVSLNSLPPLENRFNSFGECLLNSWLLCLLLKLVCAVPRFSDLIPSFMILSFYPSISIWQGNSCVCKIYVLHLLF